VKKKKKAADRDHKGVHSRKEILRIAIAGTEDEDEHADADKGVDILFGIRDPR